VEQETNVIAGDKQSNCLAIISDFVGTKKEKEEWNSVPVG
jgi:hypothetical protein